MSETYKYKGKILTLTQDVYLYRDNDGNPYYTSWAEDDEGNRYQLEWELADDYDPEDQDESDACNWDDFTVVCVHKA